MDIILSLILGAVIGAALVGWRLKGSRTVAEVVRAVIQGGGGTGPRQNQ